MRRVGVLAASVLMLFTFLPSLAAAQTPSAMPDQVQARDWILVDASNGYVYAGVNEHQRTATASLTKTMTALVALQRGNLNQVVTVEPSDLVGESTAGLVAGEHDTIHQLLYGLLLPSGNDAAMAIARAVGGSPNSDDPSAVQRFVGWMNDEAASLGLHDTHFVNPHGLDAPGHYSTVSDLAVIARKASTFPTFMQIIGTRSYSANGHYWVNLNRLFDMYPGVIGGKTGQTDNAGLCLIEFVRHGDRTLLMVEINSTPAAWYNDAIKLLNYGFSLPSPATTPASAAAVFTWQQQRSDGPVASGAVQRSWLWGPAPLGPVTYEPYTEAPGGKRAVEYWDKGRMEITNPGGQVGNDWYVTGGLLAWEMITGNRQTGDYTYQPMPPSTAPLAGDQVGGTPTYADLTNLLTAPAAPAGSAVTQRLVAGGSLSTDSALAAYAVTAGPPGGPTQRGVASVFEKFLTQQGPVIEEGKVVTEPLFDPVVSVTGYPITEPYWLRVPVGGVQRDVLIQCFQRRCLTYTPSNPTGWQVEMSNIGLAYQEWIAPEPPLESTQSLASFAGSQRSVFASYW